MVNVMALCTKLAFRRLKMNGSAFNGPNLSSNDIERLEQQSAKILIKFEILDDKLILLIIGA